MAQIIEAINDSQRFIEHFCKKGFMSRMWNSSSDQETLRNLDKKLSDCIQNLALRVGGEQLTLAQTADEKLDKLTRMMATMANAREGATMDHSKLDPRELAEIAQKAGCTNVEDITEELTSIGLKLERIEEGITSLKDTVMEFSSKLDLNTCILAKTHA